VMVMEAMGALGRRVRRPEEIQGALEWAVQASEDRRVPALVEIMCEREVNAAMGLPIDKINEYEPILDGNRELAGQIVGGVPERD
jgi:tartronate-semialdehyde synthase